MSRRLNRARCSVMVLLLAAGATNLAAEQNPPEAGMQTASRDAPGQPAADPAARCPAPPQRGGDPELPRVFVNTAMPPVRGETIVVDAGQSLKVALLKARPGDEIVLQAGATFTGPFTLPRKNGDDWIIIRSSATDALPAGRRVEPADRVHMATIRTTSAEPALRTAPGAHHYRLVGLEITSTGYSSGLMDIGDWDTPDPDQIAHHFVLDRLYVHPGAGQPTRRGISLMVAHGAVINSHIGDFFEVGAQSQALLSGNSPGPLRFVNNYFSAASEGLLLGGFDNASEAMIPQDIEICRNFFFKPARFEPGHADYPGAIDGRHHFESKYAKRVLFSGNVLLNNWNDAYGYAILLKSTNQDGNNPWTETSHVTIAYNHVRNSDYGFMAIGDGDGDINGPDNHHVKLEHNLFEDIRNRVMMVGDGLDNLRIVNNTFITGDASTGVFFLPDVRPLPGEYLMSGFRMNNNLFTRTQYPLIAGDIGTSISDIAATFFSEPPDFNANVMVGQGEGPYASFGIVLVASASRIGFVDLPGRNYRLARSSAYRTAGTDGGPLGADIDAIERATGTTLPPD